MPLRNEPIDLSIYREIALLQAQKERCAYLVIQHCDPREQYPYKSPYVIAEQDASPWERANFVARLGG